MAKPIERQIARELRRDGLPYKRIAATLGVSVGSVHLAADAARRTQRLSVGAPKLGQRSGAPFGRCARTRAAERARGLDPLHLAGCMLYWAEGAKARNSIHFANSDPRLVALFKRFLTDALKVPTETILFWVNVYTNNGMSLREIERYWLELLDLPRENARKHLTNHMPTASSGRAKNKLPYGVCSLRIHNTWMLQHIYGAIQDYAGFDEPVWLDGAY
jgi:hypothetical protein